MDGKYVLARVGDLGLSGACANTEAKWFSCSKRSELRCWNTRPTRRQERSCRHVSEPSTQHSLQPVCPRESHGPAAGSVKYSRLAGKQERPSGEASVAPIAMLPFWRGEVQRRIRNSRLETPAERHAKHVAAMPPYEPFDASGGDHGDAPANFHSAPSANN